MSLSNDFPWASGNYDYGVYYVKKFIRKSILGCDRFLGVSFCWNFHSLFIIPRFLEADDGSGARASLHTDWAYNL